MTDLIKKYMRHSMCLLLLLTLSSAQYMQAAVVTSSADSGVGSLRAALAAAGSNELITFAPAVMVIDINSPLIITTPVIIDGGGTVIITGGGGPLIPINLADTYVTAFEIQSGGSGTTIQNITITDIAGNNGAAGSPPDSGNPGAPGRDAIGIFINASNNNTILNVTITNITGGNGGDGASGALGGGAGGAGGDSIGISINNGSTGNTLTGNTITTGNGGDGGDGGAGGLDIGGAGGAGGSSIGISVDNSSSGNTLTGNTITTGNGGAGGAGGLGVGLIGAVGGAGGDSIGISIDNGSTGNTLTGNTITTSVGGAGGAGASIAGTGGNGGSGGDSIGISIDNSSTGNTLTGNTITTGDGGSGGVGGASTGFFNGGQGGAGGNSIGISIDNNSMGNTLTDNTLTTSDGGVGGTGGDSAQGVGGTGGAGGNSIVIDIKNGSSNNVIQRNIINIAGEPGSGGAGGAGDPDGAAGAPGLAAGVRVDGATSDFNAILANSIFGDAAHPGILLTNSGNNEQIEPDIDAVVVCTQSNLISVSGSLLNNNPALSGRNYRIEFFNNGASADPEQGRVFLGFITVTTDVNGNVTFTNQTFTSEAAVAAGNNITATATLLAIDGTPTNTSEFSNVLLATADNLSITLNASATTVCSGQAVTLTAVGANGVGALVYNLFEGDAVTPIQTNSTGIFVVNPTANTTFRVAVTDANNCTMSASVAITIAGATVTLVAQPTIINAGESSTLTATVVGGVAQLTYNLFANGSTTPEQTNSNGIFTVSPPTTTSFIVRVTDANGCIFSSNIVTITVAGFSAVMTAVPTTICAGQTTTLTVTVNRGIAPFTYAFSDGFTVTTNERTITHTVSPNFTTNFIVNVTDNVGATTTATAQMTVILRSPQSLLSKALIAKYCTL